MGLLYGRAGRVNTKNGGFRPGQPRENAFYLSKEVQGAVCNEDPTGVLGRLGVQLVTALAAASSAVACGDEAGNDAVDAVAQLATCAGIAASPLDTCGATVNDLLDESKIQAVAAGFEAGAADVLRAIVAGSLTADERSSLLATACPALCAGCPAPIKATKTRSMLYLGWPLVGYSERPKENTDQQKEFNEFWERVEEVYTTELKMEAGSMPKKSALRAEARYGNVRIWYWGFALLQLEFQRVSYDDLMYTTASILFVLGYLTYHCNSLFLGGLGMVQIVLTLPVALFFYRMVFQIPFFNQLHILAIYLVLGIGADDIFVFVDAWRQSRSLYSHSADRMDYTWRRASKAMLITSSTTIAAFLATAVSPIMPISSFAIYASVAIFLNYILCITFFPCVLMLYHRRLYGCCPMFGCCGARKVAACCCAVGANLFVANQGSVRQAKAPTHTGIEPQVQVHQTDAGAIPVVPAAPEVAADAGPPPGTRCACLYSKPYRPEERGMMKAELCCSNVFGPLLAKSWVSAAFVLVLGAYGVIMGIIATGMEPPTEQEEWFPEDHMYQQFGAEQKDQFLAAAGNDYISVHLAWGLTGMNRDDTSRWKPQERGVVEYDAAFDLSTEAALKHLIGTCEAIKTRACDLEGCLQGGPDKTLIRGPTLDCWPEKFVAWWRISTCAAAATYPTGALLLPAILEFRQTYYREYGADIGIIKGQLKYVRLAMAASLKKQQPNRLTQPVIEAFDAFAEQRNAGAPAGMTGMIHAGGVFWTWTFTEKALVDGIFTGFAICFPCAFLVLILSTWNIVVALWAIVAVAGIVASVLGSVKAYFGWGLGIAESIAAVIVIGLSVDYVVHLAHMYTAANEDAAHK
jgi:hypothetical protein